jgi:acylphosphatase
MRRRIIFKGRVQGVGFRWNTVDALKGYLITGLVRNLSDGSVELIIEGKPECLDEAQKRVEDRMRGYWKSRRYEDIDGEPHYDNFKILY